MGERETVSFWALRDKGFAEGYEEGRKAAQQESLRLRSAVNITIGRLRGAARGAELVGITGLRKLEEWADFLEAEQPGRERSGGGDG